MILQEVRSSGYDIPVFCFFLCLILKRFLSLTLECGQGRLSNGKSRGV